MPWLEIIGWTSGAVAVAGVILNNYRLRLCFLLWLASNSASAGLHLNAGMYGLAARDVVFLVLAIHGLILWGKPKEK